MMNEGGGSNPKFLFLKEGQTSSSSCTCDAKSDCNNCKNKSFLSVLTASALALALSSAKDFSGMRREEKKVEKKDASYCRVVISETQMTCQ